MNFIILGGTEKAGTTALFNYFYNHPEVNPSIKKETDFFRKMPDAKFASYLAEFVERGGKVHFEASPGYLAASANVIAGMEKVLVGHGSLFLFILRDPADRLVSSFIFHKSRDYIDEAVDFSTYLDVALRYRENGIKAEGISEWALESVFHGEYAAHIERYLQHFADAVHVIDYDTFLRDPRSVVLDICRRAGLDGGYFEGFSFFSSNKTFTPRYQLAHNQLIKLNRALTPLSLRYPSLKNRLLEVYKRINKGKSDAISGTDMLRIVDFYRPSVRRLADVLDQADRPLPSWTSRYL